MGNTYSALGLILSSAPFFVHGSESFFPLHARFLANILPLFSFQKAEGDFLTLEDTQGMLTKAIKCVSPSKARAAADFIFVRTFEQRQGSSGFAACAAAAAYAATIPLGHRYPLHLLFMVNAGLMFIGNLHHATGLPLLGYNPFVTPSGKGLGCVFVPFWALAFFCNYMGFLESKE